jgi:hypothetical protein
MQAELSAFFIVCMLHNLIFVNPKIDASGNQSKCEDTEKSHCDCYRLLEMCGKRHIVRNLEYVRSTN